MFGYFSGTLLAFDEPSITLKIDDVGIGYDIFVPPYFFEGAAIGMPVQLWIHHHRTEASEMLFGFTLQSDREIFRKLIRVNGVGGKTALVILGLGSDNIYQAIQKGDDALLATVPGIGKKTAQKIIVELQGSLDFTSSQEISKSSHHQNIISSLVALGYEKKQVEEILATFPAAMPVQEMTTLAIRHLSNHA